LGALDFAGGTVAHITSGTAGLVYCWILGPRHAPFQNSNTVKSTTTIHSTKSTTSSTSISIPQSPIFRPHSPTLVALGTALLWFGWMGFNGGSALGATSRAVNAVVGSHLAACAGGLTWCILEYIHKRRKLNHIRQIESKEHHHHHQNPTTFPSSSSSSYNSHDHYQGKFSLVGLCTGVVAGLATVTPACGFVAEGYGLLFGALGSIVCFYVVEYKDEWGKRWGIDDALDVFGVSFLLSFYFPTSFFFAWFYYTLQYSYYIPFPPVCIRFIMLEVHLE